MRTSDLFGGYTTVTGTSIAAPHAAGALALLLSAFPGLDQQRQTNSLLNGALDLGDPGADDVFGSGRLDALASYQWLASAPDFDLVATPSSATTSAGGSVTYGIDVQALNGFAGDVTLSLSGLSASQAGWSFSPATVTGGAGHADLTVSTATSLAPGTYALEITGTSGTNTRSTRVALVVPQPPDFSLAVTPASRSTAPGGSVDYTVSTTATGGFTGDVSLSLSGLTAAQATWAFAPATITGGAGASTLTVSPASSLAPGRYTLTITATSGALTHSAAVTLVVPDFSLSVSPSSRTTTPGTAVTYSTSVGAVNGFTGTVALSLSGLSQGTWSFTPASVTGSGTSQLRVTPTAAGTYTLTITGTSGPITHTRTVTLIVTSPADFGLAATPASAIGRGRRERGLHGHRVVGRRLCGQRQPVRERAAVGRDGDLLRHPSDPAALRDAHRPHDAPHRARHAYAHDHRAQRDPHAHDDRDARRDMTVRVFVRSAPIRHVPTGW